MPKGQYPRKRRKQTLAELAVPSAEQYAAWDKKFSTSEVEISELKVEISNLRAENNKLTTELSLVYIGKEQLQTELLDLYRKMVK